MEGLNNLAAWGVRFIAATQGIDTDQTNPTSKLILWIPAAAVAQAHQRIVERHQLALEGREKR